MNGLQRIAILGAGVAGISAAHILQNKFEVWLFEKDTRLGGHTHTHQVTGVQGQTHFIDSGFIVFNERNYPNFVKFLQDLEVETQASNMSFSFDSPTRDFFYAGTNLNGLFAQRKNLFRKDFWRCFSEVPRFFSVGSKVLEEENGSISLGELLTSHNFKREFIDLYLLPMGAAIWSTPANEMLKFPALSFLKFWKNHGLLNLLNRPQWRTVTGGSHQYVHKFESRFKGKILKGASIQKIQRSAEKVSVFLESNSFVFDKIIFATHANQILPLLADPSEEETNALGVWRYKKNPTVLHSDRSVLPAKKRAWASWNYREFSKDRIAVSYHMNRLQSISSNIDYCVSLNWPEQIPSSKIIAQMNYEHPLYDRASVAAQNSIKKLNGQNRTYFCGSYLGSGFHEDAVRSSVETAKSLGVIWG